MGKGPKITQLAVKEQESGLQHRAYHSGTDDVLRGKTDQRKSLERCSADEGSSCSSRQQEFSSYYPHLRAYNYRDQMFLASKSTRTHMCTHVCARKHIHTHITKNNTIEITKKSKGRQQACLLSQEGVCRHSA